MNIFVLYLIICCCRTIFSRTYGKDTHVRGIIFDSKSTDFLDDLKYRSEKALEISCEDDKNVNIPTKPTLKQNGNISMKLLTNPLVIRNKNAVDKILHPVDPAIDDSGNLSMEVGKHLIKVSSALHSKRLEIKPKGGEYEISVNPKFSHAIEILPRKKSNILRIFTNSNVHKKSFENLDSTKQPDSESVKSDNLLSTEEKRTESHTEAPSFESSEELNAQLPELEAIKTENVFTSEVEARDASNNQGSAFSDESEGSGDEFNAKDTENDLGVSKGGRIFDIFSRQNDTAPACTTPKGDNGQCRRIRECLLSDALDNFNSFLQHLCLIRGALVGMCCPNNPVIEVTNPEENSSERDSGKDIKQPPEGCGLNTKTRIVGGTISGPHEWTWMVALLRRNRFYCGGVIINNWYILTAAHCVLGINVKDLTVRLGEYDFNVNSKHREDISVAEIKRHAQFVTLTFQHDIALLRLRRSIQYSKFVGSICLPNQKARDYSDVKGTVVGWGTVSFGGAASPVLRQVTVPIWKNEECDQTYLLENISDSFMCAGSPEKGEDACQGDSGGPLMTLNDRGRWEVIGIVSWGRRCGDPTYPGVYTRVTTYLDWILQNAN